MVDRSAYDEIIERFGDIAHRYDEASFVQSANRIENMKERFDINVLLIGHFSSGKTTLMNKLLGRDDFLTVGQDITTAVSAEIRYSDEDKYFAVYNDGSYKEIASPEIMPEAGLSHTELYINAERIKEISDFTVVDTPGFLSGNESHEQALTSYIGKGSAFIFFIDADAGVINSHELERLKELSEYSNQIAILINRCDLVTDDNLKLIVDSVRTSINAIGYDYPIYTTSYFNPNAERILIDIISSFDAQAAFDYQMQSRIEGEAVKMLSVLKTVESKQHLDTFSIEQEIYDIQTGIERTKEDFTNKKRDILNRINMICEEMIEAVRSALMGASYDVASAIECGSKEGAQAIMAEAIRKAVFEKMRTCSYREINDIVKSINMEFLSDVEARGDVGDVLCSIADKTKSMISDGTFERAWGAFDRNNKNGNDKNDNSQGKNTGMSATDIYHIATAVAGVMSGGTLAPIEVVAILLPDIIQLLKVVFSESEHSQIVRKYEAAVIPQVISQMREPLEESVRAAYETIVATIESEMLNSLQATNNQLEKAKEKKLIGTNNYNEMLELLREDISFLNDYVEEARV